MLEHGTLRLVLCVCMYVCKYHFSPPPPQKFFYCFCVIVNACLNVLEDTRNTRRVLPSNVVELMSLSYCLFCSFSSFQRPQASEPEHESVSFLRCLLLFF